MRISKRLVRFATADAFATAGRLPCSRRVLAEVDWVLRQRIEALLCEIAELDVESASVRRSRGARTRREITCRDTRDACEMAVLADRLAVLRASRAAKRRQLGVLRADLARVRRGVASE